MRIDEIRQSNVKYLEVKTSSQISKVIAELSGNKSSSFTKLAQRYKQIDQEMKSLEIERDNMNTEVKDKLLSFFDIEDQIYTRVLKTISLTATLSKQSDPGKKFDIEGFISEVGSLVEQLGVDIDDIRKKYTTINNTARSPSLKVDYDIKESSFKTTLQDVLERFILKLKHFYDKKLDQFDEKFYNLSERIKNTFF